MSLKSSLINLHVFVFLGFVFAAPALPRDDLSTVIQGMRDRYGNASGITTHYTREAISKTMALLETADRYDVAQGRLYFRPPCSLRLEQTSPQEELLVTNGQTLWWYLPHKKEVYKYSALEFGQELRLLSDILMGLKDKRDSFQITLKADTETNSFHLNLKPDPPWADIDHIGITILSDDYDIKQIEIHNMVGGLTRFVLSGLQEKDGLKEEFFSFSPPNSTKLIEK